MVLTTFCNTYIIAECVLLKSILNSMPRYRTGQHRGIQVIREYSGTGKNRIEKEIQSNSRDFEQARKNLELYEQLSKTLNEYEYELKKRNLTIRQCVIARRAIPWPDVAIRFPIQPCPIPRCTPIQRRPAES